MKRFSTSVTVGMRRLRVLRSTVFAFLCCMPLARCCGALGELGVGGTTSAMPADAQGPMGDNEGG